MKPHRSSKTHMLQVVLDDESNRQCRAFIKLHGFGNSHLKGTDFCDHVTLYHPYNGGDDRYPVNIDEKAIVTPVGYVQTSYVAALVVTISQGKSAPLIHQAGGRRLLHITLGCSYGVKPVAANDAILGNEVAILGNTPSLSGMVRRVRI
jgi:hypothetical protein